MYYLLNDKHDPFKPLFSWGLGCRFAYHLPNCEEPKQVLKSESHHQTNSKAGYVPEELVSRVSSIYDYYVVEFEDYRAQLTEYKNESLSNPDYSNEEKRQFLKSEAEKLRNFKHELAREALERIAKRVRDFRHQNKGTSDSFELLHLLISYVLAVRLPSNTMKTLSCTERLTVWLARCWTRCLPSESPDYGVQLLDSFLSGNIRLAIIHLNRMSKGLRSQPKLLDLLETTKVNPWFIQELLVLKLSVSNNYENALIAEAERKKHVRLLKEHCRSAIEQFFPREDPQDPCFIILAVMSGNLNVMKQISGDNWKQYLHLYLSHYDPFTNFTDIGAILEAYLTQISHSSEESELALRLFKPSMHDVIQWALQRIPTVFVVIFGLVCLDLGFVQTCFSREVLGCSYRHHLLNHLTDWMAEAKFQTMLILARQYGQELDNVEYCEFFTNLISHRIEVRLISSEEEFQKAAEECKLIYNLALTQYFDYFTRSLMIWQLKNDCFQYVFELLELNENYSGTKDPLIWLRTQCDSLLRQKELDYSGLSEAIDKLRPTSRYRRENVERIFGLYLKLRELEQQATPETVVKSLKELLQHPRVLIAINQIMEILSKHLKIPSCKHYAPCIDMFETFLTKQLYQQTVSHGPTIKELLNRLKNVIYDQFL